MRDFLGGLQTETFLLSSAFKLVFAPQNEEIEPALLGMILTTLGDVYTQISFPLLKVRSCENFGLEFAKFSIVQ